MVYALPEHTYICIRRLGKVREEGREEMRKIKLDKLIELNTTIDFEELLQKRSKRVWQAGSGKIKTQCPSCLKMSVTVSLIGKPNYYCWNCKSSGDALQYLRQDGLTFVGAVMYLCTMLNIPFDSINEED